MFFKTTWRRAPAEVMGTYRNGAYARGSADLAHEAEDTKHFARCRLDEVEAVRRVAVVLTGKGGLGVRLSECVCVGRGKVLQELLGQARARDLKNGFAGLGGLVPRGTRRLVDEICHVAQARNFH